MMNTLEYAFLCQLVSRNEKKNKKGKRRKENEERKPTLKLLSDA